MTTTTTARFAHPTELETPYSCAVCEQRITVTIEQNPYSECGGAGEGGCTPWVDGDPAAEQSHGEAIRWALAHR